jgi:hypothetical protein
VLAVPVETVLQGSEGFSVAMDQVIQGFTVARVSRRARPQEGTKSRLPGYLEAGSNCAAIGS